MLWKIKAISPSKIRDLSLCLLSAILLILSFPVFNLWILTWVALVPLFFAVGGKSKGKAFLSAYIVGVIFWLGTIYWLMHVTFIGMFLLVLYLAVYFGVFGLIISAINYKPSTINFLFIPAFWVLLEYIRSHLITGFGWALLGYSQSLNLPFIQIADITGAYGVSFLLVMMNVVIYKCFKERKTLHAAYYLMPVIIILIILTYGFYRLNQKVDARQIKITVIQGNIPQDVRMQDEMAPYILEKHLNLSYEAALDRQDLLIWPETAVPGIFQQDRYITESLKSLARDINTYLLTGIITVKLPTATINRELLVNYYNSAVLLSPNAEILDIYHKIHLVPFGEYIPLRKTFSFLESLAPIGDFTAGKDYTVFELKANDLRANKFSTLICFEDVIPELSRQFTRRGADFLVNITNDAWFKKTSAPYQHLQASVFRAVENRRPVVRAANTGVSCFIDSRGRVTDYLEDSQRRKIYIEGFKTANINLDRTNSFYTRFGDVFVGLCVVVGGGSLLIIRRKKS